VLHRAMVFSLTLGTAFGIVLYFLSGFIGGVWLGDTRAVLSVKTLAFGLPFMALTSSIEGYFYGLRKVLKPAGQMMFEQTARIILIAAMLEVFLPKGLEFACFSIILASMLSEALSCFFGFVLYAIEKRHSSLSVEKDGGINRKIVRIAMPIAVSSYIRAALRTAENTMIPAGLRRFGVSAKQALSQFGQIGMATPIIFFPCGILAAVGTLLVPEVSEAYAVKNMARIRYIFNKVFKCTVLLAVFFAGIFMAFASDFAQLIYHNDHISKLLFALAPLVPLIYLDFIVDSMLNGLNQQLQTLKINILDSLIRVTLIFFLVPQFGLGGYIVILYISALTNGTLSIRRLLHTSHAKIPIIGWIIKPLLCVAGCAVAVNTVFSFMPVGDATVFLLSAKILVMTALYMMALRVARCAGGGDSQWIRKMMRGHGHPKTAYKTDLT